MPSLHRSVGLAIVVLNPMLTDFARALRNLAMKNLLPFGCSLAILATTALAQDIPQSNSTWFKDGQAKLAEVMARQPNTGRAKNVILFIGDGNGVGTNYATRLFAGQKAGGFGEDFVQPQEAFPNLALVKVYTVNSQTPDSAATATAMNSGVKNKNAVLNLNETVAPRDCGNVSGNELRTFAEIVTAQGKLTGVVTTARLTHATPAAVYAKSAFRHWEDDAGLPHGCIQQKDIAAQLVDQIQACVIDVAMGGGQRIFLPKGVTDRESKTGRRSDGRNLVAELMSRGVQYTWNDETFGKLSLDGSKPILGLFESLHMKYEHDRSGEPSLAEMTKAAITALKNNPEGFYLMVEAGHIDLANHENNLYRAVTTGVALEDAVVIADSMTDDDDTLIIVTADHSRGIAFNGYCGRGSPIIGLCYEINEAGVKYSDKPNLGLDGKPYTAVGYINGPGSAIKKPTDKSYSGARPDLTNEQAMDPDYVQQALIPLPLEIHTGVDVALYAKGPWAHLFDGVRRQRL